MSSTEQKNQIISDEDIKKQAINIVQDEINAFETGEFFITENISFDMKALIRKLRKNYWGIFEKPKDKISGQDKIFVPLTESTVDAVVKNIDLDTKDINFKSKKPLATIGVSIIRALTKHFLKLNNFGEKLDQLERDSGVDGVGIWKTLKNKVKGKVQMVVKKVDPLNCYIDPTADNIQDAYRFTERILMTKDETKDMDWINKEEFQATIGLHKTEANLQGNSTTSTAKYGDVYELYGKIPKSLITGNIKDENEETDGHIIVSGVQSRKVVVHLIEEYDGLKPYEEFQFTKVAGRWVGRGPAEKLLALQLWLNMSKNIHITRSFVSQLGLFKIRQNSGITGDTLKGLVPNSAIVVKNMDDIQQFNVSEASDISFKDEADIINWAQRTTSAFEAATGEALPSQATATEAAIQSQSSQSQFVLIKEQLGMFLDRWLMRHALPIMIESLTEDEIISIVGNTDELKEFDNQIIEANVSRVVFKEIEKTGFSPPEEKIDEVRAGISKQLQRLGKERFVRIKKALLNITDYLLDIQITNEKQDISILSKNLISLLSLAPEYRTQIVRTLFDNFGLSFREDEREEVPPELMGARGRQQVGTQIPQEELQQAITR
jgi:hypothetical protein